MEINRWRGKVEWQWKIVASHNLAESNAPNRATEDFDRDSIDAPMLLHWF